MGAAHPIEFRRRVVASFERGEGTGLAIATRFGISKSTLHDWTRQLRELGTLEPRGRGGGNFSNVDVSRLLAVLDKRRDATTDELTRAYNRGLPRPQRVHRSSILRSLKREGFVFKKNVRGPQSKIAQTSVKSAGNFKGG